MRVIPLALIIVLVLPSSAAPQAAPLDTLVPGWEQFFTIEWEPADRAGRPVIRGRLTNHSPHAVMAVRLLVDGLDATGRVVSQRVAWVAAGALSPATGVTFEVPAPGHYPRYHVRVFAYDRLEGGSTGAGFL